MGSAKIAATALLFLSLCSRPGLAASFHTCPPGAGVLGGGGGSLTYGGDKWWATLPRLIEMALAERHIRCRYDGVELWQDRPSKGCVMGADGGSVATNQYGDKVCTYRGDPNHRYPQHCYVACP